jgi:hypothetical protein
MFGCEIVCPSPMGSGMSEYALLRDSAGTNRSLGTEAMDLSTSGDHSLRASCSSNAARDLARSVIDKFNHEDDSSPPGLV